MQKQLELLAIAFNCASLSQDYKQQWRLLGELKASIVSVDMDGKQKEVTSQ